VESLLSPASVKRVAAPSPACGATHVYRENSAGEHVREPALQIITELGCTCLACRYTWGRTGTYGWVNVSDFQCPQGFWNKARAYAQRLVA
jgi:hypothetical protein